MIGVLDSVSFQEGLSGLKTRKFFVTIQEGSLIWKAAPSF